MAARHLVWALACSLAFGVAGKASAQEGCGSLTVATMDWGSAALAAEVDRFILTHGFGCTVTLVPGDTSTTFASMDKDGKPDLAPEMWINAVKTPLDAAVHDGRLSIGAEILIDGGVEGWWIPKFIADANPDIRTIGDALKRPDLFPSPYMRDAGAVFSCPPNWGCRTTTENLFRAYEAKSKGFALIQPSSRTEMEARIARAFEREEGWLGYYWEPTALAGEYPLVRLAFDAEHDKAEWDGCTTVDGCAKPKLNAWPSSEVYTVLGPNFGAKAAPAIDYIRQRAWTNATVNNVLAWMDRNEATPEEAARYFLSEHANVWTLWVAGDAAEKIRTALAKDPAAVPSP